MSIPADSQLAIEPGTIVYLDRGAIMDVHGGIMASGSEKSPIRFLPWRCSPWDRIEVTSLSEDVRFEHCIFQDSLAGGSGNSAFISAVTVHGSHVVLDHCVFRDCGKALEVNTGGDFIYTNGLMIINREGIHSGGCYGVIDSSTFINTIGYSDSIDLDGAISPPPRITNYRFFHGDDDCIDTDHTDILIERNLISGYSFDNSKGVSLEGTSTPVVRYNLFYGWDIAVAIKNSCAPILDHNAIVDNRIGVHSYENNAGTEPGYGTMTSSILWGNDTEVLLEDGSTLHTSFSNSSVPMTGQNNLSTDPLFVDPLGRDYYLLSNSPSLGTGMNGSDMGAFGTQQGDSPTPTATPVVTPTASATAGPSNTPTPTLNWTETPAPT